MKFRLALFLFAGTLLLAGCGSDPEPAADQSTDSGRQVPSSPSEDPVEVSAPVLPDLSAADERRLRREIARADGEDLNPFVFAKVGDSNTEWPQNLYGLGCRRVGFGSNGNLEPVVDRYTRKQFPELEPFPDCSPINSLSRRSAAAVSGVWTEWLMTPTEDLPSTGIVPPTEECAQQQTPLECEIDLIRPRWALIMSGTNDALLGLPLGDTYRRELTAMVDRVRELGPVPVLSTLPPMVVPSHTGEAGETRIAEANQIIELVATDRQVPLINLHAALTAPGMVDQGLAADGLHLGVYGGEGQADIMRGSAMLTIPALKYGANRRNLIWLQVLDRLDRAAEDE